MNEIYYFSGTGNSKKIAEEISAKLQEIKLYSITEYKNEKITTHAETIGLVFPIYSLGIPRIVGKAIEAMEFKGNQYIYAVATMGGAYGIAFEQINKTLIAKGKRLSAAYAIPMGSNSNLFMKIPGTGLIPTEEEQDKLYTVAMQKLNAIVENIKNKVEVKEPEVKRSFRLISKLAYKAFICGLPKFESRFRVSNCNKCGVCAKNCPIGNIEIKKTVEWLGKCEACLRCFNICPQEAILHGKMDDPKLYERYKRNLNTITMD